jgi:hypothetical protein
MQQVILSEETDQGMGVQSEMRRSKSVDKFGLVEFD